MSLYLIRDLLRIRCAVDMERRVKVIVYGAAPLSRKLLLIDDLAGFARPIDFPDLFADHV